MLSACFTVLCIEGLKTPTAVWPSILHDVPLATQNGLTLKTGEVLHVPVAALGFCALVGKDDLGWYKDLV